MLKHFILVYLFLSSNSCSDAPSSGQFAVLRPGWGVIFERVSQVVDIGGSGTHFHMWSLIVPNISSFAIPPVNCTEVSKGWRSTEQILNVICADINKNVHQTNLEIFEKIRQAQRNLDTALEVVPDTKNTTYLSKYDSPIELVKNPTEGGGGGDGREKRAIGMILLLAGGIALGIKALFSGPSASTMRRLSKSAELVHEVIDMNKEAIKRLKSDLITVFQCIDKRIANQAYMLERVGARLTSVQSEFLQTIAAYNFHLGDLSSQLHDLNLLKNLLLGKILPMLHKARLAAHEIERYYEIWTNSILTLSRGYLPSGIIPTAYVEDMLEGLVVEMGESPLRPVTLKVNDYYKIKKVVATRFGKERLLIGLEVPLRRKHGGMMKLWRVMAFPVELNAGMTTNTAAAADLGLSADEVKTGQGQSLVRDLPDFIATSDDGQEYIEMSLVDFLGCSKIINGMQTCGNSVNILQNGQYRPSCAYAIFQDMTQKAKEACNVAYEPTRPKGSARQLGNDDTFLMVADPKETHWRINCPHNRRGETLFIIPACSLCRVKIPCKCSMTGLGFFVPKRVTGCLKDTLTNKLPTKTLIHRNILPVIDYTDKISTAIVRSYDSRIDKLYPRVKISPIVFHVEDQIPKHLAREEKYQSDYLKIRKRTLENLTLYKDRFDEGLARSNNFSNLVFQDFRRMIFSLQGLQDILLGGIKSLFNFLAVITAPFLLSYVAFGVAVVLFAITYFPALLQVLGGCREWQEDRKHLKAWENNKNTAEEEEELVFLNNAEDEEVGDQEEQEEREENEFFA